MWLSLPAVSMRSMLKSDLVIGHASQCVPVFMAGWVAGWLFALVEMHTQPAALLSGQDSQDGCLLEPCLVRRSVTPQTVQIE
jgi:hypothetical protein